jgi:WD40 repeat protein
VYLWQVSDGTILRVLQCPSPVRSVAFSPDGQVLASGLSNGTVLLWQTVDGTPVRTLKGHASSAWYETSYFARKIRLTPPSDVSSLIPEKIPNPICVAFSPSGQILATGGLDRTVRLWQVADGAQLHVLDTAPGVVMCMAFSPDGQILAAGLGSRSVRVWQVTDGRLLHILKGYPDVVASMAFSPDGRTLAMGLGNGTVWLWQAASNDTLARVLKEASE